MAAAGADARLGAYGAAGQSDVINGLSAGLQSLALGDRPAPLLVESDRQLPEVQAIFKGQNLLALDCEGVNLGRHGSISLLQLATPSQCVLFDFKNLAGDGGRATTEFLKGVLQDKDVVKIIHDCKQDSDALLHNHGITLANVHDTQTYQLAVEGDRARPKSLNDTLAMFNCPLNEVRDCRIYETEPTFWDKRPLTADQLRWASQDVDKMFELHANQIRVVTAAQQAYAQRLALENLVFRDKASYVIELPENKRGLFIGRQGATIKQFCDTHSLQINRRRGQDGWIAYGSADDIERAKQEIQRRFLSPRQYYH